jgi:hypothetical protein
MAAPAAKPSYDLVCALLREHRVELRLYDAYLEEIGRARDFLVRDESGLTHETLTRVKLLCWLDPAGGEAPETVEARAETVEARAETTGVMRRAQLNFEQAVLSLSKTEIEKKTETEKKTEETEALRCAMGAGKGCRGSQRPQRRSQPY